MPWDSASELAMRKAYEIKLNEKIEIALYHQLGSLAEPKSTHKYC